MKPSQCLFQLFIKRFCLACWYSPFTLSRKPSNDCCTEKDWLEPFVMCASMTFLPGVSSYSVLSFLSLDSWNCVGRWASTNSTTWFSAPEHLQNLIFLPCKPTTGKPGVSTVETASSGCSDGTTRAAKELGFSQIIPCLPPRASSR